MTPWLFAAAAFAWVVWSSRRPAAPALPPLVPTGPALPLPGFANPSSFRESSGGVPPLLLAAILLPLGFLAGSHLGAKPAQPQPDPAPVSGLDLRGKFVGPHAAEDAAITAAITGQVADGLADDGKVDINGDGKIDPPRLTTGRQVWELRNAMRAYRTGGVLLGDRQPMVRDAIKAYLDQECGKAPGPLTDEDKATYQKAFRTIKAAALAAIGR